MYCNQCGKQIPDGSRFCNFCGANLTAIQSAPRPAPVQADPFFDIRHGVLVKYKGREKNVVVPVGVVEVEENAFTGYDIESITFPEGCKKVYMETRVETIWFPTTIEEFKLVSYSCLRGPVGNIHFVRGTKVIRGRFQSECCVKIPMYIPNTIKEIKIFSSGVSPVFQVDGAFSDLPLEVRKEIWGFEGKCRYCGGEMKKTIFDNHKCRVCGKIVKNSSIIVG